VTNASLSASVPQKFNGAIAARNVGKNNSTVVRDGLKTTAIFPLILSRTFTGACPRSCPQSQICRSRCSSRAASYRLYAPTITSGRTDLQNSSISRSTSSRSHWVDVPSPRPDRSFIRPVD
jgi:hypothetical protein